jgi:transcription initiation factor IIE alpha subunit
MLHKLGILFLCERCGAAVHEDDHGWETDSGEDLCGECNNRLANEEFRAVTGWQPASKEAADA